MGRFSTLAAGQATAGSPVSHPSGATASVGHLTKHAGPSNHHTLSSRVLEGRGDIFPRSVSFAPQSDVQQEPGTPAVDLSRIFHGDEDAMRTARESLLAGFTREAIYEDDVWRPKPVRVDSSTPSFPESVDAPPSPRQGPERAPAILSNPSPGPRSASLPLSPMPSPSRSVDAKLSTPDQRTDGQAAGTVIIPGSESSGGDENGPEAWRTPTRLPSGILTVWCSGEIKKTYADKVGEHCKLLAHFLILRQVKELKLPINFVSSRAKCDIFLVEFITGSEDVLLCLGEAKRLLRPAWLAACIQNRSILGMCST